MATGVGVGEVAANNAAWCDAVARTHGIAATSGADAWTAPDRTPPFYPDAVTLRPHVDARSLLARIDAGPGASVKDTSADLDLAPYGFAVLFDATWIGRGTGGRLLGDTTAFAPVDRDGFAAWELAWRGDDGPADVLRPALLDDPAVTVLAAAGADAIPAGAALYATTDTIGVTNVFAPPDAIDAVWRGIVAWASMHHPGATLVGYESGADLAAAWRVGFEPLAPLRVWGTTGSTDPVGGQSHES